MNFLETLMASLGRVMLVSSIEEDPQSVWVTDDRAPGGIAGYYKKVRAPALHRTLIDGRTVVFRFSVDSQDYEIRCSHLDSSEENLEALIEIMRTLERWIADGICERARAWLPFKRDEPPLGRSWWQILRAPPDATPEEIHAAYKRQALICHPDRGGSIQSFQELRAAYEEALAG